MLGGSRDEEQSELEEHCQRKESLAGLGEPVLTLFLQPPLPPCLWGVM